MLYELINELAVLYYQYTSKKPNRLVMHPAMVHSLKRDMAELTRFNHAVDRGTLILEIAVATGKLKVTELPDVQIGTMYVDIEPSEE